MCIFDLFEKTYLINLEFMTKRLVEAKHELKKINCTNYEIKKGVVVNNGILKEDRVEGCLRSHLEIIMECKEKNIKNAVILEDDIFIDKTINKLENKLKSFLKNNKDWDMIYFGGLECQPKKSFSLMKKIGKTYQTHAYAFNTDTFVEKFAKILLLYDDWKKAPVDFIYAYYIHKDNKSYMINPQKIYQTQDYSYIEKRIRVNKKINRHKVKIIKLI